MMTLVKLLLMCCVLVIVSSDVTRAAATNNDTMTFDDVSDGDDDISSGKHEEKCDVKGTCKDGVILPMWLPQDNLSTGDKAARAIVYMTTLAFMFLGISIISDRFMASIEVITSKEREVTIRRPDGETTVMTVRVWNETVSNLTLMALGSSAPEIMLSVIEIIGNKFEAGDLGPGTIVGSAAFNLFVIIGLCCYVIPDDEVRRIKHLRVFFITAFLSVFAYLWMYIIIAVSSPSVIDIWEGIVTLLFFPLTVMIAYFADKRIFMFKFLEKKYRTTTHKTITAFEGDVEMADKHNHVGDEITFKGLDSEDAEIREFEKHRKEYIEILREIRKKHPNITDMKTLEEMAEIEAMNRGPKSRAFYRIQATRKLTGGGNVVKKAKAHIKDHNDEVQVVCAEDDLITRIFFEPGHYTVMENVGVFQCTVARQGGNINNTVYVDYRTEDGTANAGSDFEYAEGTLAFQPGEQHKQFSIHILDDDIFEEDEHFYVRLSNIRVGNADGLFTNDDEASSNVQLANPSMATVMILDDDHAGIFHFESAEISFPESVGEAQVKVVRSSGARGTVKVPYRTVEGTAKGGEKDYVDVEGYLEFRDDETE